MSVPTKTSHLSQDKMLACQVQYVAQLCVLLHLF